MTLSRAPLSSPPALLSGSTSLFLDFDGTLVDLALTPDAVRVDPALRSLIEGLVSRAGGRVALVSGRSIAQLDLLFGDLASRVSVAGSHGAELRLAGAPTARPERPASLNRVSELFKRRFAGLPGVLVEEKALGVALHYRVAPEAEAEVKAAALALVEDDGLEIQHGKMMVELRVSGHDKGAAIAQLLTMSPFSGGLPVFLGDDLTDESGFAVCAARGGFGILVGDARATTAQYRLADVAAVRDWLAAP